MLLTEKLESAIQISGRQRIHNQISISTENSITFKTEIDQNMKKQNVFCIKYFRRSFQSLYKRKMKKEGRVKAKGVADFLCFADVLFAEGKKGFSFFLWVLILEEDEQGMGSRVPAADCSFRWGVY